MAFSAITVALILGSFILWPQIDLRASSWFYENGQGFSSSYRSFFVGMENLVFYGSRLLGLSLFLLTVITFLRKKDVGGINAKGWAFLFLALLLGPGLVANVILKDHWGRARPREISEFGGTQKFSPALIMQNEKRKNSSFVAGDAAFGFYLTSFAYVVPRRSKKNISRSFFWSGIGLGCWFGFCRIAFGAHFISDVFFAAFFMLVVLAGLHAALYGRKETAMRWQHWRFCQD